MGPGEPRPAAAQARRRRHPGRRGVHLLRQRHERRRRRRRRPVRVHRQVGPVELEGRLARSATPATVFIDTYELDGTLLYRIDLGVNIRAGAHYTQFLVYDFDGDGRAEMMLKTAPGTKITRYAADGTVASEKYITLPKRDARRRRHRHRRLPAERRRTTASTSSSMFQGWHEHPEVVAGHWPATLEEALGIAPQYAYPLSHADATALADYFIDVYAPSRSARNVLRNFEGFIVDGPEYLTVFDGRDRRGAADRRLQAGPRRRRPDVGRLRDGPHRAGQPRRPVPRPASPTSTARTPSAIFARGYYTRTDARRVRLGRQAAQGALVRRQRPRADDQPVQRRPARPRRHRPRVTPRSPRRASTR